MLTFVFNVHLNLNIQTIRKIGKVLLEMLNFKQNNARKQC